MEDFKLTKYCRIDIVDFYCSTFGQIPGVVGKTSYPDRTTKQYLAAATSQPVTEISVMMIEEFHDLDDEYERPPGYTTSICADQVLNPSVFDYGGDLRPEEQSTAFTLSAPVSNYIQQLRKT